MNLLVAALFVFALLMGGIALWLLYAGQRAMLRARVASRFRDISSVRFEAVQDSGPLKGSLLERWLWRGGIHLSTGRIAAYIAVLSLAMFLVWQRSGTLAALTVLGLALVGATIWPHYQYRKRAAAMVSQVPLFLDQMVRGLATGRNLDGALRLAAEEIDEPLAEVMAKVQQAVDLGDEIGDALRDAARLYELRELHFLALAVQIGRSYGSSPKEMLESVATLIRHREHAQRELRALTGETRLSAWVLSILPSAMALYMVAVNPGYINGMWEDPSGRNILLIALALQAVGALMLWRMVKSV